MCAGESPEGERGSVAESGQLCRKLEEALEEKMRCTVAERILWGSTPLSTELKCRAADG